MRPVPTVKKPPSPVRRFVIAGVALVLCLLGLFLPMGSKGSGYMKFTCPSGVKFAQVADDVVQWGTKIGARGNDIASGVGSMAEECPQSAVALGVGVVAGIVAIAFAIAGLVALGRSGSRPSQPGGAWMPARGPAPPGGQPANAGQVPVPQPPPSPAMGTPPVGLPVRPPPG